MLLQIEQIALENFQSLKDRVEIPIRPLTFLYGPNSAGKSSIFDALTFVDAVFNKDENTVLKYFKRWLHNTNVLKDAESNESTKMSIEVDFKAWEFLLGDGDYIRGDAFSVPDEYWTKSGLKSLLSESMGPYKLKIEITQYDYQDTISSLMDALEITVYAQGLKILHLHPGESDEYEIEFYPTAFGTMFQELSSRHDVEFPQSRTYKAECFFVTDRGRGSELLNFLPSCNYDHDLVTIGNHILRCFSELDFLPESVSSDRQTIPNSALSIFLHGRHSSSIGLPKDFTNAPVEAASSLNSNHPRVNEVDRIAKSRFAEIFSEVTAPPYEEERLRAAREAFVSAVAAAGQPPSYKGEMLHSFINRCLSDHLFLDQGYQVSFDVCELKPPVKKDVEKDAFVALIVTYLIDRAGRRVTFEDVGTGISCVLPVIVAMHGRRSFIQQPELHLHPALQSALGDILVESVNRGNEGRHLIETHSDYLLLRCLRRIRETSNHKISDNSNLKLKATDVSILYFDPQPDGSTKIKPIRVSSQGDFIDRWPRGFFEERGKDLFDE